MKKRLMKSILLSACPAIVTALVLFNSAQACTRVLWNNNKLAVVAGRTMDWPESTEPILTVFPRGTPHDGQFVAGKEIVKDNPAKWTSK